ncbi:MAG: hypothetical protein KatS3mg104_0920 [Phycisphaerae bacterium]|jgi:hypothetical protein|nr:MAG: hypothetical protein KatS3mg104_0920 [Phycisphaerae bacterium]
MIEKNEHDLIIGLTYRSGIVAFVIDYQHVLQRARELRLKCVYYNSGAFAYPSDRASEIRIIGWLGPEDPTIRSDLPATLVQVQPPFECNLARKLVKTWMARIDGPAWVLPKSHWAFELDPIHGVWLTEALERLGIDPGLLHNRPNAAAIEFCSDERAELEELVRRLLTHLSQSDFTILFPHHTHLVTIHHHKQLWWQTEDGVLAVELAKPSWNDTPE